MNIRRWIATLVFAGVFAAAYAEAPRGYLTHPLDAGTAYSQRARDAYAAGEWMLGDLSSESSTLSAQEAARTYERALAAFEEAVSAEPAMYEAHTYLGYIHRKLGRFDAALQAYAKALEVKPTYVYAIEYQGEAYLGLGDFARARFNYLRLYALDEALAAKLLAAIDTWTRDPGNAAHPDIAAARAFVEQVSDSQR